LANHERLTTYALDETKTRDDRRVAAGVRTALAVEEHRAEVQRAFVAELRSLPTLNGLMLLSNEHCHSRLVDLSEVLRLRNFLEQFVEKIKILVYIRPQHELATSLYDQALRAGYFDISILPDFEHATGQWVTRRYFDYADLLERWSGVFSPEDINVRIFSDADLLGGEVITDVMTQIDCKVDGFERPPRQNTSIGGDYQPVLNAINRISAQKNLGMDAHLRNRLADELRALSRLPSLQPSRSEARRFFQQFEAGNEQVRLTYRPERKRLFNPEFSKLPEMLPSLAPDLDLLVETIINLVAESKR
jgi:hypothetical protein